MSRMPARRNHKPACYIIDYLSLFLSQKSDHYTAPSQTTANPGFEDKSTEISVIVEVVSVAGVW